MYVNDFDALPQKDTWLLFRLDAKIAEQFADIYFLMDLASHFIMCHEIFEHEPTQQDIDKLFKAASKHKIIGKRVLLAIGDPVESLVKTWASKHQKTVEAVPQTILEPILLPIKEEFGKAFASTSTMGYGAHDSFDENDDVEALKAFIPDSYHQCSCASGKKYKFCCKPILEEITNAMVAAEEGNKPEALKWIEKAAGKVGKTAEVLCREAIVYSFFDMKKFEVLLEECLKLYPDHPRANYVLGILFRDKQDFDGAIAAYQNAIAHYPKTDYFHLNEVYNNLGTIFYNKGDVDNAKKAWETGLLYMPSDKMTKRNLQECIYKYRS